MHAAAQQLVHRAIQRLADDVPHGDLERADRAVQDRPAARELVAEHGLPQALDRERRVADDVALGQLVDRRLDRLRLPLAGALADAGDAVVGEHPGEHPVAPAGADQMGLNARDPAVAAARGHGRLQTLRQVPPGLSRRNPRPGQARRRVRPVGDSRSGRRWFNAVGCLWTDGRSSVGDDSRGHGRRRLHGSDLFARAQRGLRPRLAGRARDPARARRRGVAPARRERRPGLGLGRGHRRLAGGDPRRRCRPGARPDPQRQPRRDQHRRARPRQARAVREAALQHPRGRARDVPRRRAAGACIRSASCIANGRRWPSPGKSSRPAASARSSTIAAISSTTTASIRPCRSPGG